MKKIEVQTNDLITDTSPESDKNYRERILREMILETIKTGIQPTYKQRFIVSPFKEYEIKATVITEKEIVFYMEKVYNFRITLH